MFSSVNKVNGTPITKLVGVNIADLDDNGLCLYMCTLERFQPPRIKISFTVEHRRVCDGLDELVAKAYMKGVEKLKEHYNGKA